MNCPNFVEFTRECQYKTGFIPLDTGEYCATKKHVECPFYKTLEGIGFSCEYLKRCLAFEHFKTETFNDFVEIAKEYCLSKQNNRNCARYKLRKTGKTPSGDLLPDGSVLEK